MMKNALLIFVKNKVKGKVKTRLAATAGNDKAMDVYAALLQHTHYIIQTLACHKIVLYSEFVEENDAWQNVAGKQVQQGFHLGERMQAAFDDAFRKGYDKVVVIGTDCPELTADIISEAFKKLAQSDVIIGPAADGGYYLLGMKKMTSQLFADIAWSTSSVLQTTIQRCDENNLTYHLLSTLHDVDTEDDLPYLNIIL